MTLGWTFLVFLSFCGQGSTFYLHSRITDHSLCCLGRRMSTYWSSCFPDEVVDVELTLFTRKSVKNLCSHHFVQETVNTDIYSILKYAWEVVDCKALFISPFPPFHLLSLWTHILLKSIFLFLVLIMILIWTVNNPLKSRSFLCKKWSY